VCNDQVVRPVIKRATAALSSRSFSLFEHVDGSTILSSKVEACRVGSFVIKSRCSNRAVQRLNGHVTLDCH